MIVKMFCPKCNKTTHYYFESKIVPGVQWLCCECLSVWSLEFILVDEGKDEKES